MKTSLIVSTYNRPETLILTLKSIKRQSVLPSEVIIADDGSSKETKILIDAFKKKVSFPIKHIWQKDEGFRLAAIRNKAIIASAGEYLIFTDGDIILQKQFVKSHILFARKNYFCQGHRVMLNAETTASAIEKEQLDFDFFQSGITNRLYTIQNFKLSKLFSKTVQDERKVKGCNFSCFKSDALKVNGFNESFIGWGKEDAEFIARLINLGLKGVDIKFSAIAYHLDHGENFKQTTKTSLSDNISFVEKAKREKLVWCENGIQKATSASSFSSSV